MAWPAVHGGGSNFRKVARLDLIGELRNENGKARFQRGVTEYPNIGDSAMLLPDSELRLVYGMADADRAHIGDLQQDPDIPVHIDIDQLVSTPLRHPRRHRRRQVERRRHHPAEDSR